MRWSVDAPGRGASGVAARRRAAPVATGSRPAPITATRIASIAANDAAAAMRGVRDSVGVMDGSGGRSDGGRRSGLDHWYFQLSSWRARLESRSYHPAAAAEGTDRRGGRRRSAPAPGGPIRPYDPAGAAGGGGGSRSGGLGWRAEAR